MVPVTSSAALDHAARLALMALERIARDNSQRVLVKPVDERSST
jgi:hypothetical protein